MEIIDDVAIHLTLPSAYADRVLNAVNKSRTVTDHGDTKSIIVYWEQREAEYLAKITDDLRPSPVPDIPSPMIRDYKWPGIHTPFDHQRDTASFLSIRSRAFCFNEAGTGKTSAAIWAADYLMNLGSIKRVLIICPLSIMYTAWRDEVFKAAMHRSCFVAYGSNDKRKQIIAHPYDFTVINYDGVNIVSDAIAKAQFDLIIVDEANAYKTASTKRWKTLSKLIMPSTKLWMMTGTPASQSPIDAFGLARMVSPTRVPKFSTAWRDTVMKPISRFKWEPRSDAKDKVFYALQPAIRFNKNDCLDLPSLTYQTRIVPLTLQALSYYRKLKQEMLIEAVGEQISAVNAAAKLNKLLQISGGAAYTDGGNVIEFDIGPRFKALREVLDETSNKVIVFVPYRHTIQVVSEYLTKEGFTNEVINGDVSPKGRADIIKKFQTQSDPHVLVIQPQAASHGVTLTAADTIVFWSPVMSVETYLQCIGRIDRVGQANKMTVVHLQGSEVERRVYDMLQGKVDSHNKLIDLYKQELEE